jgi:hypothetical protein
MALAEYAIHVRSKDCRQLTPGYNTDMVLELNAAIPLLHDSDFHVSVLNAQIPATWHLFSDEIDNLEIWVDGAPSFVLEEGSYDVWELEALITADSFPFSAAYNQNSFALTLTNTDSTEHTLSFSSKPGLPSALGFPPDDVVVAAGSSHRGGAVNLQTVHSIFVLSRKLASTNVVNSMSLNFDSAVIQKVPVNCRPNEILHYNPEQAEFASVVSALTAIRQFDISLRDHNNVLLQLNGSNYELSLLVRVFKRTSGTGRRSIDRRVIPEVNQTTQQDAIPETPVAQIPEQDSDLEDSNDVDHQITDTLLRLMAS